MQPQTENYTDKLRTSIGASTRENRLIRIVFNADLRNSHDGLAAVAKKLRVNVSELEVGEFVVFVNSKQSALKLYAAGNTLAHFKMPKNRRMDMRVIAMIPRFFNGKELRYDDAISEMIRKKFLPKSKVTSH